MTLDGIVWRQGKVDDLGAGPGDVDDQVREFPDGELSGIAEVDGPRGGFSTRPKSSSNLPHELNQQRKS
jgi:hypothetical protein